MSTQYFKICFFGSVQTPGATITNVAVIPVAALSPAINGAGILADAVCFSKDGSNNMIVGRISRRIKRIAGTITALSTVTAIVPVIGDAALVTVAWTLDVLAAGNTVRVRVTGIAATVIDHYAYLRITSGPV